MIYLSLFYEFFKAGLFAVGGGLATIPFMKEISLKTGWFTLSQLTDMIAVSESTPGPMGVNCATYVGYETAGILGGIIATLGLIAPSIIIIIIHLFTVIQCKPCLTSIWIVFKLLNYFLQLLIAVPQPTIIRIDLAITSMHAFPNWSVLLKL